MEDGKGEKRGSEREEVLLKAQKREMRWVEVPGSVPGQGRRAKQRVNRAGIRPGQG